MQRYYCRYKIKHQFFGLVGEISALFKSCFFHHFQFWMKAVEALFQMLNTFWWQKVAAVMRCYLFKKSLLLVLFTVQTWAHRVPEGTSSYFTFVQFLSRDCFYLWQWCYFKFNTFFFPLRKCFVREAFDSDNC